MRLACAIADYQRQRAAEGLAPATIASLTKSLRQLAHALSSRGVLAVADVTPADLDAHLMALADRGLAHSTRLTHATVIRECFRRWHHDGLVIRNPALDLPVGDDEDAPLPEAPLEPAEVAALIAAITKRDALDLRNRAIVEVLYGCALRLSECLHLDVDDIDLSRRTLQVRGGKNGKDRTVPAMKGALGAVKYYLAVRRHLIVGPDRGVLFLTIRGSRIGPFVVQQLLADLSKRAGLARRVHPHLLRHSIAVAMLRGGGRHPPRPSPARPRQHRNHEDLPPHGPWPPPRGVRQGHADHPGDRFRGLTRPRSRKTSKLGREASEASRVGSSELYMLYGLYKHNSGPRRIFIMTITSAHKLTASDAREHFSDVMNQVGIKGERIVLQRNGKDLVAVVPVEDLELLEALEDRMDVAAAKLALKERGALPWSQVKTKLGL